MAIRVRRSIKVAPGVRLNLGKKGISTSIGGKGLTFNISKKGTRVTASLPGTGISASHLYKSAPRKRAPVNHREYSDSEVAACVAVVTIASFFVCWISVGVISWVFGIISSVFFLTFVSIVFGRAKSGSNEFSSIESEDWNKRSLDIQRRYSSLPDRDSRSANSIRNLGSESWQEKVARLERERKEIEHASPGRLDSAGEPGNRTCFQDYLGPAAEKLRAAKLATKERKFDEAWRLYHEVKELYLLHAGRSGFTAEQTLSLDSNVHEHMANQLRLEGRHLDAFIHILYWVMASAHRPIQAHSQKLGAYFRRCKMKNTSLDEVEAFVSSGCPHPDYRTAQAAVSSWISKETDGQ